jgi:hypothetical protein
MKKIVLNISSSKEVSQRIEIGLKEAEAGEVKPWKEVKAKLIKLVKKG